MEGKEEAVVAPAPAPDAGSGLRLRPVNTKSAEKLEQPLQSTNGGDKSWEDEPMTPAGRVFTEMDSTFACVVILGFKYPIDRQKFKTHIETTLMKHKRFTSRVEMRKGRPWWTQVQTNVDNHVHDIELTPEQKVEKDFVLNYTTDVVLPKPFDQSRPLWDMHLMDAKLGDAEGCCIARIHHAIGDGTSLISLLMACCRSVDKPDLLPSVTTVAQDRRKAAPHVVTSSFVSRLFLAIQKYLWVLWYSVMEIGKAAATLIWLKDSPTVIKGFAGVEYLPKKYRYTIVKLEDFKYVSKTLGVTINDVYMAMAGYGLRKYLEHRAQKDLVSEESKDTTENEVVEGKTSGEKVKSPVSKSLDADGLQKKLDRLRVRAVTLVNMRAAPGLQELSEMMNGKASRARWGNQMGYLLLPLAMKTYSSPVELLRHAQAIGKCKKLSLEGSFSYASGTLIMKLFGQKAAAAVVTRATLQTTISLSNIMGPTEHVTFPDNPILYIIPSVVGHPHSLTLHLQSYSGEVALVAMATKELIPDPEYLLERCIDGLQILKQAATEQAPKK